MNARDREGGGGSNEPHPRAGLEDESNGNVAPPDQKKLSSMVIGDGGFEEMMKERSRMRKEKEEHSLAQVTIQLTAAERALAMETQRRIESTRNVQESCARKIREMECNFQRILEDRSMHMEERLASAQQKVEELTARFEEEKYSMPREIESRGRELRGILETLQKELADERSDRLNREGRILKQMDDQSSSIFGVIAGETSERERISKCLQTRIEENKRLREKNESDLQAKVQNELSELEGMIEMEKQERKLSDDEIISALDKMSQRLQGSLSVISS